MDIRAFKIADIAVFDMVATMIMAITIMYVFDKYRPDPSRSKLVMAIVVFIWTFTTAFLAHIVSNTPTKLGYYIRLNSNPRP